MRDLAGDEALQHLSLNTATVREQGDLLAIMEAAARHGISCLSPWRDQVHAVGLERAVRAVRDGGFRLSGYCRGGMFPAEPARRREMLDDNRRAIDEAAALGAPCLVLVVGGLPQFSRPGSATSNDIAAARREVADAIATLLDHANAAGVDLAIEPLHPMYAADRACVNTLAQANALCDELSPDGKDGLGIAVDVYHVWWDPGLKEGIERAGAADRLFAYHICDWLVPTTDLLNDRGMMGDGVIDLPMIRGWMEAAGYRGMHEVEIFSAANWWKRDPDSVLATCKARHGLCA
jgi:sugar phosphate isomerase/epimerase